jgi:anti-anti-sigma factor
METNPKTEKGAVRFVKLRGGLTVTTVENMKREVSEAINCGGEEIVLDFGSVDHIDSSGLGAVIASYVSSHRKGKRFSLVNVNDRIKEVFLYTHLSKIVTIYDRTEDIGSLEEKASNVQPPP